MADIRDTEIDEPAHLDDGEWEPEQLHADELDPEDLEPEWDPDEWTVTRFELAPPVSIVGQTWALMLSLGFLVLGHGLQGSLIGIRSTDEGFSLAAIGVMMAIYYAGFLFGSRLAVRVLGTVGHIRVFAALASAASAVALLHALVVNEVAWTIFRFGTGMCIAGLIVVVESWLNELASDENRGRIGSAYMIVFMGGMGIGQALINVGDTSGVNLFILASILVSVALVPLALSTTAAPAVDPAQSLPLRELFGYAPLGVISAVATGVANGALVMMSVVYGRSIGMSTSQIATFVGAMLLGSVVAQFPLGVLSDMWNRRKTMLCLGAAAAAAAMYASTTGATGVQPILAMFLLGAFSFPLYSITVAHTHDWVPVAKRPAASGQLVFLSGVGAICGPLLAGAALGFTSEAFFWTIAAVHGWVAIYAAWRLKVRSSSGENKVKAIAYPSRRGLEAADGLITSLQQEQPRGRPERRRKTRVAKVEARCE